MTDNDNQKTKKTSLATLVTGAFVVIVVLSLLSTSMSYSRLFNFSKILNNITENSLPEASRANQINDTLKEILYLTERLTNANNHSSRRIAVKELLHQEIKLTSLIESFDDSIHLNNQIKTARREIADLNALVIERINKESQIQDKLSRAYKLQNALIASLSNLSVTNSFFEQASLPIVKIVALAGQSANINRLQPVRQIARDISDNITRVKALALQQANLDVTTLLPNLDQLQQALLGKEGLTNLRVEQLQIIGRTRGRGNFLHNLILDISRLAGTSTFKINQSIVEDAQKASSDIATQVNWSITLAVFVVLFVVIIIYFINQRIVARLVSLNESVLRRIKSESSAIEVDGNDEISELAKSFVYFSEKVEQQTQQLQQLSLTDSLTDLPNRRAMDERLTHDVHTAKRGHWPLSVILLDIDFFKLYNDFYGHVAGDECLKNVALALKNVQQRESDFMARYGGEEFAMLLPSTDKEGAIKVAKRIKANIESLKLRHKKSKVSKYITVSIGIATFNENSIATVDNILISTDRALYGAKESGRNCYFHFDDFDKDFYKTTAK
ncbi:MAG: diguanylate cyclase [Gammaproteobacteria bacterium]|nr:diguanylate cyclase [Gammaproteobacteria bacterium]